ncbi:hypothetical protein OOJ09_31135 [Mesorhizobium qingshengii]|uniref:Uncharacterized protein n=1 Tax=Mesorhizobium qingshengii TaxID=1165689 RepID=A0ABT4R479_9HYPH|nr:hypothetical protein [Mesorhizobium qingshengii]MCZ8548636.1 hypothetical protein [Mesorhizobium qingshengii]
MPKTVAANESLVITCGHPACYRSTMLDIQALIDRLGPEMQDPIDEMKVQPAKRRGSIAEGNLHGTHCHPGH